MTPIWKIQYCSYMIEFLWYAALAMLPNISQYLNCRCGVAYLRTKFSASQTSQKVSKRHHTGLLNTNPATAKLVGIKGLDIIYSIFKYSWNPWHCGIVSREYAHPLKMPNLNLLTTISLVIWYSIISLTQEYFWFQLKRPWADCSETTVSKCLKIYDQ